MRTIGRVVVLCGVAAAPVAAAAAQTMSALVETLFSPDRSARDAAVRAIGALGPQKLDELCATVTFQLGPIAKRMQAEERANDPVFQQVLDEAARAAAAMGPAAALPLARMATTGGMSAEGYVGLGGLIELGARGRAAGPVLRAALDSDELQVRWTAGKALAAVDTPGWPLLVSALRSPRVDTRSSAALALGYSHSPAAVEPLLTALADPDEGVRFSVSDAVRELGPAAADAVARLLPFEDVSPADLAKVGERGVPALVTALSSPEAARARRSALTLGLMNSSIALAALTRAWDTGNSPTRRAAVAGVVARFHNLDENDAGRPAIEQLVDRMLSSPDAQRRLDAVNGLSDGGPTSRSALEKLTRDPDARVREVARVLMEKYYSRSK